MPFLSDESRYYNRLAQIAERRHTSINSFEPARDQVTGIVYALSGSIYVEGRGTDFVHIYQWGIRGMPGQAYRPPHVNVWEGAGVVMLRNPKAPYQFEIIKNYSSPYPTPSISSTSFARASSGPHGQNHWYPTEATVGPDPVLVWAPAIQIFKAVASGMDVTVGPLYYGKGSARKYFPTETIDLTTYLPSAGNCVRVLVYLNIDTNALGVVSSTEVSIPGYPDFPDTPANAIASAYFYLEDTYTSIDMEQDYIDARRWLSESGALPTPTQQDQILIAGSDLEWTLARIMTIDGDVMTYNGEIMWTTE